MAHRLLSYWASRFARTPTVEGKRHDAGTGSAFQIQDPKGISPEIPQTRPGRDRQRIPPKHPHPRRTPEDANSSSHRNRRSRELRRRGSARSLEPVRRLAWDQVQDVRRVPDPGSHARLPPRDGLVLAVGAAASDPASANLSPPRKHARKGPRGRGGGGEPGGYRRRAS